MNLKAVIVPAKVLTDGKHRIRIGMSHHGATRYFLTRFVVDNPNCISSGVVVGIPNASYINQKLMQYMTDIYKAYDSIDDSDYLTCAQLKERIEKKLQGSRPLTLFEVVDLFESERRRNVSEGTLRVEKFAIAYIKKYFKDDFQLNRLTTTDLYSFRDFLDKHVGTTSQHIYLQTFRQIVAYAIRTEKVTFKQNPFRSFKVPKANVRDINLSIEEFRRVRDTVFEGQYATQMTFCRDMFLLSFYLCGMNLVDILRTDFSKSYVRFKRKKTESRRSSYAYTEFTIQPEARTILDKLYVDKTIRYKGKAREKGSLLTFFFRYFPMIATYCKLEKRFVYYSARKTFAQLANELMIKDSIIEYCIGDAVSNGKRVIDSYITVNKRIADKAIRKVFDAVASDKSIDELMEDNV